MIEDATQPSNQDPRRRADREEDLVWWAIWVGLILALAGLVDGLTMAFKKIVIPCPDGTIFPSGHTDFDCYVHPHAGLGIAIAVFAALLGILVVLSGVIAIASLRGRTAANTIGARSPA